MKDQLLIIWISITALFFIMLIIKTITKWRFCALCASISVTWLTLLGLYWAKAFNDPLLIALLIGNSVVGIYYLAEKKITEKYHVFRLPFFLTLLLIGYALITQIQLARLLPSALLTAFLWAFFILLYIYRNNSKFKTTISAIINCCKNW